MEKKRDKKIFKILLIAIITQTPIVIYTFTNTSDNFN